MVINNYFIGGYSSIDYWWLLVVILLMASYSINGY